MASLMPSAVLKMPRNPLAFAGSVNSETEKPQLANLAPENSKVPESEPTAATAMMMKAIQMDSQSSFFQRSLILNLSATTTSLVSLGEVLLDDRVLGS